MTKGGKKRRGPTRSEGQDSLEKQISQFNKKRKYINDSSDNLERIQNRSELVDEEEMAKVACSEDDIKNEGSKVPTDVCNDESHSGPSLSDTNAVGTGSGDDDTVAKEPSGTTVSNEQLEENGSKDKNLSDAIPLETIMTVEDASTKDTINKPTQSTISSNQAVMVIEMAPEQQCEVEAVTTNKEEGPYYIDASTQVEISDNTTTPHLKHTTGNKVTSDPLISGLLDELSALNRLVMSCKRELETARRKRDIWMKNNKPIK